MNAKTFLEKAVSKDETRENLCYIHRFSHGASVATDGHRLHITGWDGVSSLDGEIPFSQVVPVLRDVKLSFGIDKEFRQFLRNFKNCDQSALVVHGNRVQLSQIHDTRYERDEQIQDAWFEMTEPAVGSGRFGVNMKYLADAVFCMDGNPMVSVWGELDPIRIDSDEATAVIMPMRIRW